MKRAIIAVLALATVAALGVTLVQATALLPEPCLRSTLCRGLLEVYELEQGSDSNRYGVFMGQLFEPNGVNVVSAAGKTSGNAADFTSNSTYLWANGGGGLPTTTAFWFSADILANNAVLITRYDSDRPGPSIYIGDVGSGQYRVCMNAFAVDEGSAQSVCSASNLIPSTWYHVVAGFGIAKDASGNPIGSAMFVTTNAANKSWSAPLGFQVHPGSWQVRIGAGFAGDDPDSAGANFFDGKIDQLAFWGRELTDAEIDILYNGGTNKLAYPFVTE